MVSSGSACMHAWYTQCSAYLKRGSISAKHRCNCAALGQSYGQLDREQDLRPATFESRNSKAVLGRYTIERPGGRIREALTKSRRNFFRRLTRCLDNVASYRDARAMSLGSLSHVLQGQPTSTGRDLSLRHPDLQQPQHQPASKSCSRKAVTPHPHRQTHSCVAAAWS